MTEGRSHGLVELVKTVVYAVLIAITVRTFLFEPFSIPSGSMIPTLLVGDYLFVSKFSYGYSRFSMFGLPPFSGRVFASRPERGDVVVFKLPADNSTDYIKRIVGLPGDQIQMKGGILHINGEPVRRVLRGPSGDREGGLVYEETLPGGRKHAIIETSDNGAFDNTGIYVVPEDHYFMMGDNRDSSRDSRFIGEVGYVPFENLIGRARIIFFSVEGDPMRVWMWPSTVRFDRLLKSIQ